MIVMPAARFVHVASLRQSRSPNLLPNGNPRGHDRARIVVIFIISSFLLADEAEARKLAPPPVPDLPATFSGEGVLHRHERVLASQEKAQPGQSRGSRRREDVLCALSAIFGGGTPGKMPSAGHIRVFGHKVPDTDAVCCALARAWDLRQQGLDAKAYRLGELNKETE